MATHPTYVTLRSPMLTRQGYAVDLRKLKSPEDLDELIAHLSEKNWVTSDHLATVQKCFWDRYENDLEEPGYGL